MVSEISLTPFHLFVRVNHQRYQQEDATEMIVALIKQFIQMT